MCPANGECDLRLCLGRYGGLTGAGSKFNEFMVESTGQPIEGNEGGRHQRPVEILAKKSC